MEEGKVEIGLSPFTKACLFVHPKKLEAERIGQFIAVEGMDLKSMTLSLAALFFYVLAFARGESGKKVIEVFIALVEPVVLLS